MLVTDGGATVGVVVVEDDATTRQALIAKIGQDAGLHLAGEAGTLAEARALLGRVDAGVLLADLGLPDGDGTELIAEAVSLAKPPEVMVLTVFDDEAHVVRAIERGATGYLLKDADAESICRSIHDLLAGEAPINGSIARHLLRRFRKPAADLDQPDEPRTALTPRETEVLQLVARGYTSAEIGGLLELSVNTVNSHIKHVYEKLAVRSRSEAVFEAVQQGLIQIDRDDRA